MLTNETAVIFIIRRVFRIYPIYIVAVFIQIMATNGGKFSELTILIPQILLIGDFFGTLYTLAGVEWTLRVEIIFYLFMVVIKASGQYEADKETGRFYIFCYF